MRTIGTVLRDVAREEVDRVLALKSKESGSEYMSVHAACTIAQVSPGTIRRWIRQGRIRVLRTGRPFRLLRADVIRVLGTGGPRGR